MNPSSSRASSDIISMPQGGSKVIWTSTCLTPGQGFDRVCDPAGHFTGHRAAGGGQGHGDLDLVLFADLDRVDEAEVVDVDRNFRVKDRAAGLDDLRIKRMVGGRGPDQRLSLGLGPRSGRMSMSRRQGKLTDYIGNGPVKVQWRRKPAASERNFVVHVRAAASHRPSRRRTTAPPPTPAAMPPPPSRRLPPWPPSS